MEQTGLRRKIAAAQMFGEASWPACHQTGRETSLHEVGRFNRLPRSLPGSYSEQAGAQSWVPRQPIHPHILDLILVSEDSKHVVGSDLQRCYRVGEGNGGQQQSVAGEYAVSSRIRNIAGLLPDPQVTACVHD